MILAVNCSVPYDSVLGPLKFIAYTEDLQSVVEEHNYANDGQLNVHILLSDVSAAIPKMENCVDAGNKWYDSKRLQLNPSKTEIIWLVPTPTSKVYRAWTYFFMLELTPSRLLMLCVTLVSFSMVN